MRRWWIIAVLWGVGSAVTPAEVSGQIATDAAIGTAIGAAIGAVDICPVQQVMATHISGASAAAAFGAFGAGAPGFTAQGTAPARVFLQSPMEGAAEEVVLQRLNGDATALDGQYVRARSDVLDRNRPAAPGRDGQADFRFDPILDSIRDCPLDAEVCPLFDAVNLYWHVDRFAADYWVDRMGLDIDFQAEATAHIIGDGGFADAPTLRMKVAAGDIFMKNGALSDDLIYHEYTHLVTADLGWVITTESTTQERALSEGYADYFAASFTDDPVFGEWVVTCPSRNECEGPENDTDLRRLDLPTDVWNWGFGAPDATLQYGFCLRYHAGDGKCKASFNNFTDVYVWATIWGNLLWDMRSAVGADVFDRIALEAIRRHGAGLTFETAAADLLAAEQTLHGGQYAVALRTAMAGRRVTPAEGVRVAVPDAPDDRIAMYPVPASTRIVIEGGMLLSIHDITGRPVWRSASADATGGGGTLSMDVSGLAPGWYAVRIASAGNGGSPGKVRVKPLLIVR